VAPISVSDWLPSAANASSTGSWVAPVFSNAGTTQAWASWNQSPYLFTSTGTTTLSMNQWVSYNTAYEETAEQKSQRERQQAEYEAGREQRLAEQEARRVQRVAELKAANRLAEDLLMACLSPDQAADHALRGWFDVEGSMGNRYRIFTSTPAGMNGQPTQAGNVVLLDAEGRQQARYCVHPPDGLPHADAWLAQKLALEADEDTVLAVANMPWHRSGHQDIRPAARQRHLHAVRDAA
jgi:hypothetical protein